MVDTSLVCAIPLRMGFEMNLKMECAALVCIDSNRGRPL
jgi:hypothetical protein